jgi:hypothetical protein
MRASFVGRLAVACALLAPLGCGDDSKSSGPPQLVKFLLQVPGEMDQDLLAPPDGGVPAVSGAASFRLVFNALLDGDKIETVMGNVHQGKTDVVTVTWASPPAGAPALVATSLYDPSGALAVNVPGPKILVSVSPGLPSGAQLQVKLDRTKITGKDGAPFTGPDSFNLSTIPFAAALNVMPDQAVAPMFMAQLTFTNIPAMAAAQQIQVTSGGMPVMVEVTPDGMDPRKLSLTPMGGWTVGRSYTVTVSKDAADRTGVKLGADLVTTFSVADPSVDAGSPPPDGGAGDGGADAGSDAAPVDATSVIDAVSGE